MEDNNRQRGFPEVMVLSQSTTRGLELNSERVFINLQILFVKGKQQPKINIQILFYLIDLDFF